MSQLIEAALLTLLALNPDQGSLSRYDAGVMDRVLNWRHANGVPAGFDPYRKDYDGYLAVADCDRVGEDALLDVWIDGQYAGRKLVLISDCAGSPQTVKWMIDHRIAGELDYNAWQSWGIQDGTGAWVVVGRP